MSVPPKIAFIIVSYNTRDLLEACLRSIHAHTRAFPFEIIVVVNLSQDGSREIVSEKFPRPG